MIESMEYKEREALGKDEKKDWATDGKRTKANITMMALTMTKQILLHASPKQKLLITFLDPTTTLWPLILIDGWPL